MPHVGSRGRAQTARARRKRTFYVGIRIEHHALVAPPKAPEGRTAVQFLRGLKPVLVGTHAHAGTDVSLLVSWPVAVSRPEIVRHTEPLLDIRIGKFPRQAMSLGELERLLERMNREHSRMVLVGAIPSSGI